MIAAICRIRIVGRPKRNLARLPFVNAVQEKRGSRLRDKSV